MNTLPSEVRTVRSRPEISPAQRSRVLHRDNHRCVLCGTPPSILVELHLAHLVSVADAQELGLSETDTWHDENLVTSCAECNLGLGRHSVSARLIAALAVRVHGRDPVSTVKPLHEVIPPEHAPAALAWLAAQLELTADIRDHARRPSKAAS